MYFSTCPDHSVRAFSFLTPSASLRSQHFFSALIKLETCLLRACYIQLEANKFVGETFPRGLGLDVAEIEEFGEIAEHFLEEGKAVVA